MLSQIFLGMSLVGAEWVLYLLILLSILSIAIIIERWRFYHEAIQGLTEFRERIRKTVAAQRWAEATQTAEERLDKRQKLAPDLEAGVALALLRHHQAPATIATPQVLTEVAQDAIVRSRLQWERGLAILATIGANAPFVGLFGTVLGIIKAFHDLSKQVGAGAQGVTAGISEALIATAVGILVAVPAVVAFNLFQKRVKAAVAEAESLKSFLVGKLAK
jgi:biopolymer transport protein ExbB